MEREKSRGILQIAIEPGMAFVLIIVLPNQIRGFSSLVNFTLYSALGEGDMNFNAEQAACLSGCSQRQLRYWKDTGIIQPVMIAIDNGGTRIDRYDFRNLVELRTIVGMLQRGITLQKIRKTLAYLRENTDYSRPLAECKLVTDGYTIFEICDNPESILDTLRRGQVALCIALDGIVEDLSERLVEMERDRVTFLDILMA
jgi:DNA-binding transcriptional MerR regulator